MLIPVHQRPFVCNNKASTLTERKENRQYYNHTWKCHYPFSTTDRTTGPKKSEKTEIR